MNIYIYIYIYIYTENHKAIYSVKTQHILVINATKPGDMFRFTQPSSGKFLKQSTFSECAQEFS